VARNERVDKTRRQLVPKKWSTWIRTCTFANHRVGKTEKRVIVTGQALHHLCFKR
jgi:hypothetical protein